MERRKFLCGLLGAYAGVSGIARGDDEKKDFYFACNNSKEDKDGNGVIDFGETEGPNKTIFGSDERITFIASLFGKKGKGLTCKVLNGRGREIMKFDRDRIELNRCSLVHSVEAEKLGAGKYSAVWEYDTNFFGAIFGLGKKASYAFEVRNESGKALRQKVARKEIEEMDEGNNEMKYRIVWRIKNRKENK